MTDVKTPASHEARLAGHLFTLLVGLMLLAGAVASLTATTPGVLTVALVVLGAAGVVLPHYSWRGSRAAWAFAVALDGALLPVLLFGAPKIARAAEVNLGLAAIPTVIAAVAFVLMISLSSDFEHAA